MNYFIWILAAFGIGFIIFQKFFGKGKYIADATIFELNSEGLFVKVEGLFEVREKQHRPENSDKTIKWVEITSKSKRFLWRPIRYNEFVTTNKGKKHITLAWLGGNELRLINPKFNKYKIIQDKDGKFQKVKDVNLTMELVTEEDQYFLAEMYDTLDALYKKKDSWLDSLLKSPAFAIGIVAITCIILVYMSNKTAKEVATLNLDTSRQMNETKHWIVNAIETVSNQKIDANTVKTSGTPGG